MCKTDSDTLGHYVGSRNSYLLNNLNQEIPGDDVLEEWQSSQGRDMVMMVARMPVMAMVKCN